MRNRLGPLKVPAEATAWPVLTAVALNLVPVFGVVFWGWSAFALVFLYWLENVVVGLRTLASMIANAAAVGGSTWLAAAGLGPFFSVHYGLFCFVHGVFVVTMFASGSLGDASPFDLPAVTSALFTREPNLAVGLFSILLWQGVQFVLFVVRGEARTTTLLTLMGEPYPRIMVLHFTILAGGFLVLLLNQPIVGLVLLALLKGAFDVFDALKEAKREGAPAPANNP